MTSSLLQNISISACSQSLINLMSINVATNGEFGYSCIVERFPLSDPSVQIRFVTALLRRVHGETDDVIH